MWERRDGEREPLRDIESRRSYELCPSSAPSCANSDKPRRMPVKVDPKVFFANERTFLAWMHMALILGGIAIAIISFADKWAAIYGFVLLPVALLFVLYALRQYYVRAHAIRSREAGPYADKNGPLALGIVLILASVTNVFLHLLV